MGKQETAERQFAQALIRQLHEEYTRLHGKEMGIVPVQLVFASKHTLEELLRQITVLETERALREPAQQPQASAEDVALVDKWVNLAHSREIDAWDRIRASLEVVK